MNNNEWLIKEIESLKKEKKAIILAHYYQNDEIQAIADLVGDSYQLSSIAKNTDAQVIVFCGVHFMAETAKILSPEKEVILPVKTAGCYMADTITAEKLKEYRKNNPDDIIISYVNTSAEVKALSDVCVTSSNALKIMKHYQNKKIMYVPDQNLAKYAKDLYKDQLNIDYWDGFCYIHHHLSLKDLEVAKTMHPEALVVVHPEVPLELLTKADFVGSTKGILDFVKKSSGKEFIVGTEQGILYQLKKDNPDKEFFLLSKKLVCRTMKMTTLEDVYNALTKNENGRYEIIEIEKEVLLKAQRALNKMLELSK